MPWSSPGCPAVRPVGAPTAVPGQEKFTMKTPSVRLPRDAGGGSEERWVGTAELGEVFLHLSP